MPKCAIVFHNNPKGVYFAGQTLAGTATLTTDEPLSLRGAYIVIKGFGEVHMGRHYDTREQCLHYKTYVLGKEHGAEILLPAGSHSYEFQLPLPAALPSSFVGDFGLIQYEVVFTLDRAWKLNKTFSQHFTVIEVVDLNAGPIYRTPLHKELEATPLTSCFRGSIKVSCHIPFSGYTAQQQIPFHVSVHNASVVDCVQTKVKLMQRVNYMRSIRRQKIEHVMAETVLGPVPSRSDKEFDNHLRLIPTTPTTRGSCSIITIVYGVVVELQMPRFHRNIKFSLPITIGTYPIRDADPNTRSKPPMTHLFPGYPIDGGDKPKSS